MIKTCVHGKQFHFCNVCDEKCVHNKRRIICKECNLNLIKI